MSQKFLHKLLVWGFLFLYLLVACISFCHAVEFFSIGNPTIMSAVLAFAFELGLSLSLMAILLSDKNKSKALPWILMIILTFVQVVGNVYSTFKYIALSDVDYYIYLQKPLLFWIEEISQDTVQVIISWIIGAILPIVALFMTDMVASNLKIMKDDKPDKEVIDNSNDKEYSKEEVIEETIEKDSIEEELVESQTKEYEDSVDNEEKLSDKTEITNVVVHDEPIKNVLGGPKESKMKINKAVDNPDDKMVAEDEVANRNKASKSFHKADDPYFELPTK